MQLFAESCIVMVGNCCQWPVVHRVASGNVTSWGLRDRFSYCFRFICEDGLEALQSISEGYLFLCTRRGHIQSPDSTP